MRLLKTFMLFAALAINSAEAWAQGTVLQGGPWTPGQVPQYSSSGGSQPVVIDGGGAGGGAVGVNPKEFGITARGTGTPPYAGMGSGPLGTNFCMYDAPVTNPTGYHYLCFDPNARGGGLLAYGNGGTAAPLPFQFNINGISYPFPNSSTSGLETQRSVTSAYTLGQGGVNDCDVRLLLGGGTFYAVSTGSIVIYGVGCRVRLTNTDPLPTGSNSTGAKFINFVNCDTGNTGTYLWPQQTMEVTVVGAAWVPTRCPGLWQIPAGTFVLNVDPTNGSDVWGAADGLALTTRALKSAETSLYFALRLMQANSILNVKLCSGCNDPVTIHWATHGDILGSQGGVAVAVDCNGGTMSGSPQAIQLYFGPVLAIKNCTIQNGVGIFYRAILALDGNNNTFVPVANGIVFSMGAYSQIYNNAGSINVAAGTGDYLVVSTAAFVDMPPINQLGNTTWNQNIYFLTNNSSANLRGWTTNGFTVTGKKYDVIGCSVINGVAGIPGTIAGTTSCTQAN